MPGHFFMDPRLREDDGEGDAVNKSYDSRLGQTGYIVGQMFFI